MNFDDETHSVSGGSSTPSQPLRLNPTQPQTPPFIVLASKNVHMGAMRGFIFNGGEIPLDIQGQRGKFSISFIKYNDVTGSLQIRAYADEQAPQQQSFVRTKKEIIKEPVREKTVPEQGSLERIDNDEVLEL